MADSATHVLLSSMKNEGPFVLEFVAHHRVLGFDAIHLASNDCTDGTDLLLDQLAAAGVVTHTRTRLRPGDIPQHRAYAMIARRHHIQNAGWIAVLDVDEFLMVATGAGRVQDLTALAGPEVDVITLSSMNFGTSLDPHWHPGRVTTQFDRRLPLDHPRNRPVKSLSRGGGRWRGLHNHHPVGLAEGDSICHMRGNGQSRLVPNDGKPWHHIRQLPRELITHELAWYNHYPIKSIDSYMLRRQRGRGATPLGAPAPERHDEKYWETFAAADIEDTRIQTLYGAETEAEMARLLALPGVAEAQAECHARYRAMIAALDDEDE